MASNTKIDFEFDFEGALQFLADNWPKEEPKPELRFERGMTILDILDKNVRLLAPIIEDLPPLIMTRGP